MYGRGWMTLSDTESNDIGVWTGFKKRNLITVLGYNFFVLLVKGARI